MPDNLKEVTCKNFASAENKGEMNVWNKLYKEAKINSIRCKLRSFLVFFKWLEMMTKKFMVIFTLLFQEGNLGGAGTKPNPVTVNSYFFLHT